MPIFRTPYFSPLSVSGCVLWFDAADTATMTFSGNTVTSWTSKGSSAVSTNVAVGSFTNPTYTSYNSLPALGFNGTSTYVQTGNVSVPGTGTTWITCSVNLTPVTISTPVDSSVVLATESPSERAIRYVQTGGITYYAINSNLTNTAGILRGVFNENANGIRGYMDTAAYFTGFTNGTQTVSNTTAVNYVATNNQPFLMGKWASGFLNGYIYESLVYNCVLTLAEYRQVEGYLAQKWGFTGSLPAGHPGLGPTLYRWKVPLARLPYYKVYDPRTIPNLTLWFDAADCNTMNISSGLVTSWLSKGSAVVSTSVVTGGGWKPPLYTTYSNRPALGFDGLSTYIQTNTLSLSGTGSTWIASAVNLTPVTGTTPVDASLVIATNNPEKAIRFNCNINATCYSINSNVGNTTTVLRQDTNNNVNGIRGFIDTAGYFTAFGNGTQTVSNTTTVNYLSPVNQRFYMGSWNVGVLNGYIHEILIYNSTLSLAQYRQVEGYLAQKWGYVSSLSTSHPAISMPVGAPATGVGKQTISYLPRVSAFSPLSITGLQVWLDANDTATITQDATSNISQWSDKSSNGLNAVTNSYVGWAVPKYVSTGTTKYVSLAPNQALYIPSYPYTTSWSVFSCMCNVTLGGRWYISPYNDLEIVLMGMGHNGANKIFPDKLGGVSDATGSHIEYTSAENTNGTGAYTYYRDGSLIDSNNTANGIPSATVRMGIGANGASGFDIDGTYYPFEILMFNQYLGNTDRQKVEGYLAWKWGLQTSLPIGHPYKSAAP